MEGIHLNLNEVGGHYLPYLTDDEMRLREWYNLQEVTPWLVVAKVVLKPRSL